jgi:hypothetical protein
LSVQDINKFIAPPKKKIAILQAIICDDLRRRNMLDSGNDREQIWLLIIPRVKAA